MCNGDLINRITGLSQTLQGWLAHLEMNYSDLVDNHDVVDAIPPYNDFWKIQGNLVDGIQGLRYAIWKISKGERDGNNTWWDRAHATYDSRKAAKETANS